MLSPSLEHRDLQRIGWPELVIDVNISVIFLFVCNLYKQQLVDEVRILHKILS